MLNLVDTLRRLVRDDALSPLLEDPSDELLSVGRELAENPRTVRLPDGRQLSYGEVGDPDGEPVVAFHGVPSGRLGAAVLAATAHDRGIRLIAPERPGVGESDPDPNRELTDWSADVTALLDALDIDAAPVVGISGGGPYALACGAVAPDRFPRVAVCCGVGPMAAIGRTERLLFSAARYAPRLVGAFLSVEVLAARYAPERTVERRVAASAPDDEALWRGPVGDLMLASMPSAVETHGVGAFVRDLQLYAGDWGFDLADIEVPVGLWYGRADRTVPEAMGRYLLDAVPTADGHFCAGQGHIGVVVENEAVILDWLVE
ncbi:alpha/beta fold hydrolase [Halorarius litoreus]|uniref:alpha/beta fold hydrolase n=1 Tax=Halorarius litoreus TaxID=2962676 RepID=UPI0020CC112A|nr:alpha/beta hydrolase [Halorarius litoreus]